jgi:hypothetical protein
MVMRVRQRRLLSRFDFDAYDERDRRVGEVAWPAVFQARNARLQWHAPASRAGEVAVRSGGQTWRIGLEYLSRGFHDDTRYQLDGPYGGRPGVADDQADGNQSILAMAERHVAPGGPPRQQLVLHQPFAGRFVRASGIPRIRWDILEGGQRVGGVAERSALMLRRELIVDLPPTVDVPTQLFFFFLMVTMSYS